MYKTGDLDTSRDYEKKREKVAVYHSVTQSEKIGK